ncbi:unnamed protein product [Moneuplotes crassus]|uniref:Uncharacterized protein n=1 Tax=Euplotes crassus TaxID=5936 RepID=A0AAD1YA89_EUPCR|nr:unnamed protein product [Moneuplotes crassus]
MNVRNKLATFYGAYDYINIIKKYMEFGTEDDLKKNLDKAKENWNKISDLIFNNDQKFYTAGKFIQTINSCARTKKVAKREIPKMSIKVKKPDSARGLKFTKRTTKKSIHRSGESYEKPSLMNYCFQRKNPEQTHKKATLNKAPLMKKKYASMLREHSRLNQLIEVPILKTRIKERSKPIYAGERRISDVEFLTEESEDNCDEDYYKRAIKLNSPAGYNIQVSSQEKEPGHLLKKEKEIRMKKDICSLKSLMKKLKNSKRRKMTTASRRVSIFEEPSSTTIDKILSNYNDKERKNSVVILKKVALNEDDKKVTKNILNVKVSKAHHKMLLSKKKSSFHIKKQEKDKRVERKLGLFQGRSSKISQAPMVPVLKTQRQKVKALPLNLDLSMITTQNVFDPVREFTSKPACRNKRSSMTQRRVKKKDRFSMTRNSLGTDSVVELQMSTRWQNLTID